jgi:hypothetical protein
VATLVIDGDALVVRLSAFEKLGALRGDVRTPLSAIRAIRVTEDPWPELRGVRAPGTGIPGVISLCTLRGEGFRDFAAVYRHRPAVVVEADDAHFNRLIVSCEDAAGEAQRISEALAELAPAPESEPGPGPENAP